MALIWRRKEQDDEFTTAKPGEGPVQFTKQEPFVAPAVNSPAAPVEPSGDKDDKTADESGDPEPALPQISGGFFGRVKSALGLRLEKTKSEFVGKIKEVIKAAGKVDEHLIDRIEEILIQADVGAETTMRIVDEMKEFEARGASPNDLLDSFKKQLHEILGTEVHKLNVSGAKPYVFLIIGVNGVGKTTTIGKLAAEFSRKGLKTMIVAGDTFRAAAVDQLKIWADRTGSAFISKGAGADPAGIAFDGIRQATEQGYDVVLVDTAGRLHTKVNLMEELKKIVRVSERLMPGAPHSTLLVLDATTGQNAISQAKVFSEAIPLDGIVMTKLDGTAKGGVLIGVRNLFRVPVVKIGVGEGVDDLRDFNPTEFVNALFEE